MLIPTGRRARPAPAASQRQVLTSPPPAIRRRGPLNEASTRVQAIQPSGLPLAWRPRTEREPLGLSPELRAPPTKSQQRTSRRGQATEHGPGTTRSTSHQSNLQSCVHSLRATSRRTAYCSSRGACCCFGLTSRHATARHRAAACGRKRSRWDSGLIVCCARCQGRSKSGPLAPAEKWTTLMVWGELIGPGLAAARLVRPPLRSGCGPGRKLVGLRDPGGGGQIRSISCASAADGALCGVLRPSASPPRRIVTRFRGSSRAVESRGPCP